MVCFSIGKHFADRKGILADKNCKIADKKFLPIKLPIRLPIDRLSAKMELPIKQILADKIFCLPIGGFTPITKSGYLKWVRAIKQKIA